MLSRAHAATPEKLDYELKAFPRTGSDNVFDLFQNAMCRAKVELSLL